MVGVDLGWNRFVYEIFVILGIGHIRLGDSPLTSPAPFARIASVQLSKNCINLGPSLRAHFIRGMVMKERAHATGQTMPHPAQSILGRLSRFHTQDADEARAFLRAKEYEVDLSRRHARQIDLRINGVYLPGTYVGYYQYGAPIVARSHADRHDYWINLPLEEPISATIGAETLICGPQQGFVSSPTLPYVVRTQGCGARLHVQVTEQRLNRQLSALLGQPPSRPVVFAASIDLTKGYGRSLGMYVGLVISDLDGSDALANNPITAGLFEECITTKLLLAHPNNYSDALRRLEKSIAPASVKRAIEYMNAELSSPLGIADLVAVSGVAGRTLFKHFKDAYGTSPIQYLQGARFDKAHEALSRAEQTESISSIALHWGFTHLGRFSVEYRKRYGESPSQTLTRSRLKVDK
jgi:AraC-like DNA-binding protein